MQTHDPAQFSAALKYVLNASTTSAEPAINQTIHLKATPVGLKLEAFNGVSYLNAMIENVEPTDTEWDHIVIADDRLQQLAVNAGKARATLFDEPTVTLDPVVPTDGMPARITIRLQDDDPTSISSSILVDEEWPDLDRRFREVVEEDVFTGSDVGVERFKMVAAAGGALSVPNLPMRFSEETMFWETFHGQLGFAAVGWVKLKA